ncbi:Panacea domain-containing protein [Candidatus Phytoplasma pruni]|uniref:DUF4065 domain-containing protein n=1 Tax=Candidatus Phytoplasma pruni TaxID=479893 RepID=A0A851HJA5_9MOLU|nr:type II toxin-antitoxin system antitoxin SocA domain-containing protein [Candidatus Phytoplasma pruni]NWN45913.1 DUF4065 domain-containing protein [Candidatus Phytoplasma pruni]
MKTTLSQQFINDEFTKTLYDKTKQTPLIQLSFYLIKQARQKGIQDLTNLKLQKLMFYTYARYLAVHKKVLFDDHIEAWSYGPVIPNLYFTFRVFGNDVIDLTNTSGSDSQQIEGREEIKYILDKYGAMDPYALMEKTQSEDPWFEVFDLNPLFANKMIHPDKIYQYYSQQENEL